MSSPHLTGFWLVAGAFAGLTAFGTIPTPLWPLYALNPTDITIAFAVMVLGAGAGLYFLGHLSDRFGRRRVIAPALATALVADAVIGTWPVLGGLIVGRVLTGVAVGLMASTATTYLNDLYAAARPGARSGTPATVATLANLGGFSVGPLISGALAEWGPGDRLRTPYVVMGAILTLALVAVGFSPETVDRRARTDMPRFRVRPGLFPSAALIGFCAFAVFGIFSSLGSLIVQRELHVAAPFTWGIAAFVTLAASAVAQVLLPRWTAGGVVFLLVGLGVVVSALWHPSLALYLIGATIAGAGVGLLFKAGLTTAIAAAEPAARAGVLAIFFVICYLGMGIPPVLLAIADSWWDPRSVLAVFGMIVVAASGVAARIARRATSSA